MTSYRLRKDLDVPFHFPNGSVLSKKDKILTGAIWAQYCPQFLEAIPDESVERMITEDVPNTTPSPVIVEETIEPSDGVSDNSSDDNSDSSPDNEKSDEKPSDLDVNADSGVVAEKLTLKIEGDVSPDEKDKEKLTDDRPDKDTDKVKIKGTASTKGKTKS